MVDDPLNALATIVAILSPSLKDADILVNAEVGSPDTNIVLPLPNPVGFDACIEAANVSAASPVIAATNVCPLNVCVSAVWVMVACELLAKNSIDAAFVVTPSSYFDCIT